MSRKRARRIAARRSKPKNRLSRPGNRQLVALVIDQVPAAATPSDLAKRSDRDWFCSQPHRSHRLRRTIAGEFPDEAGDWVLVRQLEPGVRLRLPFKALAQFPSGEAPEHVAHAMYDLIFETRDRPVFGHEIIYRSRMYELAGDQKDPSQDAPRLRH
jgi:hypothetical protein